MLVYLFLMIFTCCTSEPQLGFPSKARLPEVLPRAGDTEDCHCYNKAGPTVADALQTDQQRIVVYLYKDADNNFKVYTPSREKQLLLPDLGLGKGDILTNVDSESAQVHRFFNPNNAVKLTRKNLNVPPNANLNTLYLSVTGQSGPKEQSNVSNSQFRGDSYSSPKNNDNSNFGVLAPDSGKIDLPSANSDIDNSLLPVKLALDEPFVPTNPAVLNKEFPTNPVTPDEMTSSLLPGSKNPLMDNDKSSDKPGNPLSPFKGSHLPYAFNDKAVPVHVGADPSEADSSKNSDWLQVPDSGSKLQLIPVDKSPVLVPVTSPVVDDTFSVNQAQPLNELYSTVYEYVTFDDWFDQQMQRIQNTGQSPNKNFDLSSFKQQIEKTLYENGMYVTKDGVLIDSEGKALDVANLKLRPILIGDSVAYNSVFTLKDEYELPPNLPYLEAVLVTLVNPPKILGVIPLGKTYVPRMSYRRNFDYYDLKLSNTGNKCKTGKCLQRLISTANACTTGKCPQETYYGVQQPNYPTSSAIFRSNSAKNITPKQAKLFLKTKVQTLPHSQRNHARKEAHYKPSPDQNRLSDLNKVLKALLNKVKKNEQQVTSSRYKGSNKYKDVFEEKTSQEEDEIDMVPWFRIIGGNAATSSGTPVSSKGRSGYPYRLAI